MGEEFHLVRWRMFWRLVIQWKHSLYYWAAHLKMTPTETWICICEGTRNLCHAGPGLAHVSVSQFHPFSWNFQIFIFLRSWVENSIVYMSHTPTTHACVDGQLGWYLFLATMWGAAYTGCGRVSGAECRFLMSRRVWGAAGKPKQGERGFKKGLGRQENIWDLSGEGGIPGGWGVQWGTTQGAACLCWIPIFLVTTPYIFFVLAVINKYFNG